MAKSVKYTRTRIVYSRLDKSNFVLMQFLDNVLIAHFIECDYPLMICDMQMLSCDKLYFCLHVHVVYCIAFV